MSKLETSRDGSLYVRYRPRTLDEVVGQTHAVRMLRGMIEKGCVPHCVLFSGPSGVGKTTLARILAHEIGCRGGDLQEVNAADSRGIDLARELNRKAWYAPLSGRCRVWIIDEAHQLTSQAQDCLLKLLEDSPSRSYFFLASTDPQKLKKTIRTRAAHVQLQALDKKDIMRLVRSVAESENFQVSDYAVRLIARYSSGSARRALVLLEQLMAMGPDCDEDEIEKLVIGGGTESQAIDLARALIRGENWSTVANILQDIKDDPESVRRIVCAYAEKVLVSSIGDKAKRAADVLQAFSRPFWNENPRSMLVLSAYLACGGKR